MIPLVRYSLLGLLAIALAACVQTAPEQLPPVHELTKHEDDHQHHEDELLVLDPPADYLQDLPSLGLSVIDVTHLDGIGSHLYHLKIENGAHPFHARHQHGQKYPNVLVDVHHHFEQHQRTRHRRVDTSYTSPRSANWDRPAASCGQGIRIGVVDGGVDMRHAAFKGRNLSFKSFHRKGQRIGASDHGTAVASMIIGQAKWGGLLPGAQLYAANVFHLNSKGRPRASAKGILQAVNWLIKQDVHVINFSIGGSDNVLMKKAVDEAHQQGIILVSSAGNSGPFTKKKSFPAAYEPVIAIAAIDRTNRVARFSSAGDYVEFSAPGVGIWTAVPGGGKPMSGTSFSLPLVATYAASLIGHNNLRGLEAIRAELKKIAQSKGGKKWNKFSGWGPVSINRPC